MCRIGGYKKQGSDGAWLAGGGAGDIEAPESQPVSASRGEEAKIVAKC